MIKVNNRKVKSVIQKYDWDCAPSSIKMLMSYYRVPIRNEVRFRNMLNTRKDGTSVNNVKKYLSKHFELHEGNGIEEAKNFLKKKHMLFVCINDAGLYSHYVVVTKITYKHVYYLDPKRRPASEPETFKKRTLNYFMDNWKDYDYWFLVPTKKLKVKTYKKIKRSYKRKRK